MRRYEETHPWLDFTVDLRQLSTDVWVMLGECQSKCEHIRDAPILPDTARELNQLYLIKGVVATVAIEGNPITEDEALECWEGKSQLPPNRVYQGREIDNIKTIYSEIVDIIQKGSTPSLTIESIKDLQRKLLNGLPLNEDITPGELTKIQVGVSMYRGAPPEDCEYLLGRLCDWLNGPRLKAPNEELTFVYAIIRAIIAHLYIVWIHPFGDGNGRTARFIELISLISSGIPATAAHLLSNHYNQTRTKYYEELDYASRPKPKGDIVPFLSYAIQGLLDGLQLQVGKIQEQQWKVVWQGFVYRTIKGRSGPIKDRKLALVFAISDQKHSIPIREIPKLPQLVSEYSSSGSSVLKNDIDELVKDGLLARERGRIRARFDAMYGFKNIAV